MIMAIGVIITKAYAQRVIRRHTVDIYEKVHDFSCHAARVMKPTLEGLVEVRQFNVG